MSRQRKELERMLPRPLPRLNNALERAGEGSGNLYKGLVG